MSDRVKFGYVPAIFESPVDGTKPTWDSIRTQAIRAEKAGFDKVWVPDELLWRVPVWHGPSGFWECVALSGALAAATSTIEIGTWVLSALHRNPGLTVKVAHTLDEITGGSRSVSSSTCTKPGIARRSVSAPPSTERLMTSPASLPHWRTWVSIT